MHSDGRIPFARRSFLSRLGGGFAAFGAALGANTSSLQAQTRATAGAWQPMRHSADDWYDKIPGKHRMFLDAVSAHGSRDMPIWGTIFGSMSPNQDLVQVRVYNLLKYIEGVQAK